MWNELWERYRASTIGIGAGFLLGIIYLFFGFWNMLVFAFIVYVGYYIGSKVDRRESVFAPISGLYRWFLDLAERWRMFR